MFWFLGGIVLLIVGYFTYGRFVVFHLRSVRGENH